jgi:hypothetical protein
VFVHNPKVAGTSIRKSIEHLHDVDFKFWHQGFFNDRVHDLAHIPYNDLSGELKGVMANSFVFGFVRDPLERFFSSYAEFKRQHTDWYPAKLGINEFIRGCLTEANARYDWRFIHFCPQHYFFYTGNKCIADFIGHYKSLGDDWSRAQSLGKFETKPLTNARHREHQSSTQKELLSVASLVVLNRLYERDCRLFGYPPILNPEDIPADTHEYRIEQIHSPEVTQSYHLMDNMTSGERIAYFSNYRNTNE